MSEYSLEIAKKKLVALKRAERRLRTRLDDIDWEYENLKPALRELEAKATVGELPQFTVTEDD